MARNHNQDCHRVKGSELPGYQGIGHPCILSRKVLHPRPLCIHINQSAHNAVHAKRKYKGWNLKHGNPKSIDESNHGPNGQGCQYGCHPVGSVPEQGGTHRRGHAQGGAHRYVNLTRQDDESAAHCQ